ncbi:hypothetical protein L3Y34_012140 [Caenorhabditis briggsae]|uniref:SHSP domain-containing protein n=3 Tax=Caenorhabditis briggsae TaxID=6238 RepID=A0AAE8ZRX1_CAEBR|nr:hypothetical protein L3Y34_012140 [Caenorhabditis briggsae]
MSSSSPSSVPTPKFSGRVGRFEKKKVFKKQSSTTKLKMTLATRHADFTRHDSFWKDNDMWLDEFRDWPMDWPKPRDFFNRFSRDVDSWWKDWPTDWPRMDAVMPRFSTQLDRVDRNWRTDPYWMNLYPRWAEPIFKEGIDVNSNVVNDERKFAVDMDCYQFRPEEIQVKTLDDTLMIEGKHEDIRDRDNFTKMYFVRKYQLPRDVDYNSIQSSIDAKGRLQVEASKFNNMAINGRERLIPIEGAGRASPRYDSGTLRSQGGPNSPIHVQTEQDGRSHSSRSGSRLNDSPGSRDVYSSHSYSYHRSDSRNRLSPHDVNTTRTDNNRTYSPVASRVTTSGAYNTAGNANLHEERSSSRAQSHRSESRNGGYRVESPVSTTTGILRNGNSDSPNSTQREYRSIQILRKTY